MKIDRLISIIMILLERRRVSIPELAKLCEVSARTISRDLETINQAGIPIVSYPGLHGGVGIMENYKLEKRLFSTADVTTLLMGLGCIRTSLSGAEVANALTKVQGLIPEEQRREIELKAGRLAIDMTSWVDQGVGLDAIGLIQQAMEESRLLEFDYVDRMGQPSLRRVEPYRLLLKGMRWYLDGYCLEREDFRLFKLTRMTGLSLSGGCFAPREYHPEAAVKPQFQDREVVTVELFVLDRARDRFLDVFGATWIGEPYKDGFRATITLPDGSLGYQMLLGFGIDCKCLGPAHFRKGFTAYLQKMIQQYDE